MTKLVTGHSQMVMLKIVRFNNMTYEVFKRLRINYEGIIVGNAFYKEGKE